MTSVKPWVIFVLGGPGAGKGTQCAKMVEQFGFIHLSAGDLLRQAQASGSKDGELIKSYIKDGRIVPVEITISLLQQAMDSNDTKKFLIDGFPRNRDNLDGWERHMTGKADVKFVLFFECPQDVCVERVLQRSVSSGRTDDNMDSLKKRYVTYVESTMSIINHYEKLNMVRSISSVPSPEEVFQNVKTLLEEEGLI